MTTPFLGSKISLISKSKIRYEGILYTIDPKESTIALANVRSFGTEDRKAEKPVPGKDEVYEYIIFRASDIEDLVVDIPNTAQSNPGLSDPAIIQAQSSQASNSQPFDTSNAASVSSKLQNMSSNRATNEATIEQNLTELSTQMTAFETVTNVNKTGPSNTPPFSSVNYTSGGSTPTPQQQQQQHRRSPYQEDKRNQGQNQQTQYRNRNGGNQQNRQQNRDQRSHNNNNNQQNYRNNIHQMQRRPMPQMQQHQHQQRGLQQMPPNFRGRQMMPMNQARRMPQLNRPPPQSYNYHRSNNAPRTKTEPLKIDGEFDFEKANQEFKEIESKLSKVKLDSEETKVDTVNNNEEKSEEGEIKQLDNNEENVFYDKQKSFFDKISCEALERSKGKVGKIDWKKERELNTETFGTVANRRPPFRPRGGFNNFSGYSRPNNHSYRNGPSSGQGGGDMRRTNGPSSRSRY